MLTNKGFIRWANEHVVILIAHNELGHEEIEDEKATGKDAKRCPLYPGLRCREHLDIAVETDNVRDDELPVIPFVELCPNSWLVRPDGEVEAIAEEAQFTAKGIREATQTAQKALGEPLSPKTATALMPHARAALAALDDEAWKKGLTALAALRAGIAKPGKGIRAWIALRLAYVEEEVGFLFEDVLEDDELSANQKRQAIAPLFEGVDVQVGDAHLPVRARMARWLEAHPATSGR